MEGNRARGRLSVGDPPLHLEACYSQPSPPFCPGLRLAKDLGVTRMATAKTHVSPTLSNLFSWGAVCVCVCVWSLSSQCWWGKADFSASQSARCLSPVTLRTWQQASGKSLSAEEGLMDLVGRKEGGVWSTKTSLPNPLTISMAALLSRAADCFSRTSLLQILGSLVL